MKMAIVLAVCLAALAAASSSASALQMLSGAPYACAELLRQPQCSPVAAPLFLQQLAQQSMLPQQSIICQPLRQQCCMQLSLMDMQSRCQALCAVAHSVVRQLKLQMVLQQAAAGSLQMMMPVPVSSPAQAITPVAMVVAQVAQNLPAMCGLFPVPSSCTTPCALSAAILPCY